MGENTESFGELLRRHRGAAGLTQEALAERAGLSSRGIADLERGVRRAPYRGTVTRLIEALGLDAAQGGALASASQRGHHKGIPLRSSIREHATAFVGREQPLVELSHLLARSRLLTLVGVGGIGKTRLALALADETARSYRDGVWLVELAALVDPLLVPNATATALGLQSMGGRTPTDALVEYLERREVLLVLDNCEHLVLACAELADRLVRMCPAVRLLATSREVLGVQGEVTWSVPPLGVPPLHASLTPDVVNASASGRLFVDRARLALPTFDATTQNATDIARICQQLDGIPLAVELAAARVKVLSVGQIAARLDDALQLLTSGGRLAPARQQTLRATLTWSYELLSEPEQRLFDRLSVFAGGCTLEAAEAVCSGEGVAATSVLDGLARLVDKSLVLTETFDEGPVRYRLLEPVRQYAQERLLERGEDRPLKDRHAEVYIALAEHAHGEIHRPNAVSVMNTLDREHDNVRVALRWLLSQSDLARTLRLAGAMGRFWLYRSHVVEGEAWLRQALELPGAEAPTRDRLNCVSAMPVFAWTRGDQIELERWSIEELRLSRQLGNPSGEGFPLLHVAQAAVLRGDLDTARTYYQAGVDVSRAHGTTASETLNLVGLANLALEDDQIERARAYAEAALAVTSEGGWTRGLAQAHRVLGQICHRQGDFAQARASLEASLSFSRKFGARWWTCGALIQLGKLATDERDVNEAREWLAEGLQLAHELGDWPSVVAGLDGFADFALVMQEPVAAQRLAAAADATRRARGSRSGHITAAVVVAEGVAVLTPQAAIELALSL